MSIHGGLLAGLLVADGSVPDARRLLLEGLALIQREPRLERALQHLPPFPLPDDDG